MVDTIQSLYLPGLEVQPESGERDEFIAKIYTSGLAPS